jgi:hypothetical protein
MAHQAFDFGLFVHVHKCNAKSMLVWMKLMQRIINDLFHVDDRNLASFWGFFGGGGRVSGRYGEFWEYADTNINILRQWKIKRKKALLIIPNIAFQGIDCKLHQYRAKVPYSFVQSHLGSPGNRLGWYIFAPENSPIRNGLHHWPQKSEPISCKETCLLH